MVRNDLCSIVQRLSILLWPWPGPGPTPTGSDLFPLQAHGPHFRDPVTLFPVSPPAQALSTLFPALGLLTFLLK